MARRLAVIPRGAPPDSFPDASQALREPNGLLAAGGDLTPARLLCAYRRGIFPWFNDDDPVLWWSPDPRTVLWPAALKVSRSLRQSLRQRGYQVRIDTAYADVMQGCAAPRAKAQGTWITADMLAAYVALHRAGHAHSVEVWHDGALVGGLYGVALGQLFCGESMFSRTSDASKVALHHLCGLGFTLIDCQVENPFLTQMGAVPMARERYLDAVAQLRDLPGPFSAPVRDTPR